MFPYVRDNVEEYLSASWDSQETQDDIQLLITQSQKDFEDKVETISLITGDLSTPKDQLLPQLVANVTSQMDIDRKIGALKTLQGHIWKQAFTTKALVAELYDDVYVALDTWNAAGKVLAIYSSGSVGAQKLLFSHTKKGDLTGLFSGFYDTAVGFKREKQSYVNILTEFKIQDTPSQCMFLTDIYEEAVAAKEAGMWAVLVIRPGNYPLPDNDFTKVETFLQLE
jgi:methylthioribulose 1-phosphate dehydratase/enolase-phosphatase E1